MRQTIEIVAVSTLIHASPENVFSTLVTPDLIKEYLSGADVKSEWKVGSKIEFSGTWNGKSYEDKGRILSIDPGSLLRHTYWSSLSGKPDKSTNYVTVTYTIEKKGELSELVITQSGVETEQQFQHLRTNWSKIAENIKRVAERI